MGRKIEGGKHRKVVAIDSDDLVENGGQYQLTGKDVTYIYNLTDPPRGRAGGKVLVVYPVTDPQINSGEYRLLGGNAIPITTTLDENDGRESSRIAVPVYPIEASDPVQPPQEIFFFDTFTDSNGTSLDLHTPDVSTIGGYTVENTVQVQGNQAVATQSATNVARVDTGITTFTVTVEINLLTSLDPGDYNLYFLYEDSLNYTSASLDPSAGTMRIIDFVAGSGNVIDSGTVPTNTDSTYTWQVINTNGFLQVFWAAEEADLAEIVSGSGTYRGPTPAARTGIGSRLGSVAFGDTRFDDLTITGNS